MTTINNNPPRVGMLATIRHRRAIIQAVDPFDGPAEGRTHLVTVAYIDTDGPSEETVLWEREVAPALLEPNALPNVAHAAPMLSAEFDALQRATRWSALSPYVNEGIPHQTTITAPFFGAVQAEEFQLVPLLQALQMPRISLLLADDVGLGKTIEAGLILTELILRRRIRRILIITPATLRTQWQQEMKEKFSLSFELIDRAKTHETQKRFGFDANPWRTHSRIITSYYYLRQPDILEQFMATTRLSAHSAQLPWDLLIVDEAHNLMPSPFGKDSDLAEMLRQISPYFEHKIFLSATPHNGHTRSFSGLLEQLDPVRFIQTTEFTRADRERIGQVVVRRLKREINALDDQAGRPPRFSRRIAEPLELYFGRNEKTVAIAFQHFRKAVYRAIAQNRESERMAGSFALEVLNKRLLSAPHTFANSWFRFQEGIKAEHDVQMGELTATQRALQEELEDDRESESRQQLATKTAGAWLKPFLSEEITQEIGRLDLALERLGLRADHPHLPNEDARYARLQKFIAERLQAEKQWRKDERLIIFTEYKTTLDYLLRRLREDYRDSSGTVIRELFGGMGDDEREQIKIAFNDESNSLRILVATDAASEGLNLQESARYVLHYDIPWNPSRLDQRNGRLDRHGQARDVYVFHFASRDDADIAFLARIVEKVEQIREDLGSMGELFDAAFERQFGFIQESSADILSRLDRDVELRKAETSLPTTALTTGEQEQATLNWLRRELDLDPETLRELLEIALAFKIGRPRLERLPDGKRMTLIEPERLLSWKAIINETLRDKQNNNALAKLLFDPTFFIETRNNRPIFRPRRDTKLLHLGHPLLQRALSLYARERFPGGSALASRWIVRTGDVPPGASALLLVTVEELAVNELRETFHHWVTTIRLPISAEQLLDPLPHLPAADDRPLSEPASAEQIDLARDLWDEIQEDVKRFLKGYTKKLNQKINAQLSDTHKEVSQQEKSRFRSRIAEIDKAMESTTLQKLEEEWEKIERRLKQSQQISLFESEQAQRERETRRWQQRQSEIAEELGRRKAHYQGLRERLQREEKRVLEQILPKRHQLRGDVQVFPVTIELRLPR